MEKFQSLSFSSVMPSVSLRREALPDNRRTVYAVLTPAGVTATRSAFKPLHAARQDLFDDRLTDTDVADLRRVLGKLLRRLDTVG